MKHNLKITLLILAMFVAAQIIVLHVANFYSPIHTLNNVQTNVTSPNQLPFGLAPPPENQQMSVWQTLFYLIPSFVIAISLFFLFTKLKAKVVLKGWFFVVIVIALSVSLISFFPHGKYIWIIALLVSLPLAFFKTYKRNLIIHNITELLVYPGIAVIFISLLNSPQDINRGVFSTIAILVIVSLYDMWAVWHSNVMKKMVNYQVGQLKIMAGFFIPYIRKDTRKKIKNMSKSKRKKGIKVPVAILGGGDVAFPAIAVGTVLQRFGFTTFLGLSLPLASLIVILGATLGLASLLIFSKKEKMYPAMPFISVGIFVALGVCYLIF